MAPVEREDRNKDILLKELSAAVRHGLFSGVHDLHELANKLPVVYLVRHGETQANVEKRLNPAPKHMPPVPFDAPASQPYPYDDAGEAGLTEKGYTQAHQTAMLLGNLSLKPTALYVSPQERAYETGKIIANALDVASLQVCPNLRERGFGPYAGIPIAKVSALCAERNTSIPDGLKPDELIGAFTVDGDVTAHWINQTPKYVGEDAGETWPKTRQRMVGELVRILADSVKGNHNAVALASHGDASRMLIAAVHEANWCDVLEHQNEYVGAIQNGQVITLDMNQLLNELLSKQPAKTGMKR